MKKYEVLSAKDLRVEVIALLGLMDETHNTERLGKINSLSLLQVEKYLVVVKEMQKQREHAFMFSNGYTIITEKRVVHLEGMGFKCKSSDGERTFSITPGPTELSNLITELGTRKVFLEHADRERVRLYISLTTKRDPQFTASPQSTVEVKQESSAAGISEKELESELGKLDSQFRTKEEEYLLGILDAHHQLIDKNQTLQEELAGTQHKYKESETLVEQTLAHNEQLQQDIEAVRLQLDEAKKFREESTGQLAELTASYQKLQAQSHETSSENGRLKEEVLQLKQGLHLIETTSNLAESKILISKKDISVILKKNNCNLGWGIFSHSCADDNSLKSLQTLLKNKKSSFTYDEIKDCIKDIYTLELFKYPLSRKPNKLKESEAIFRDIAFHFASSVLNPQAECTHTQSSSLTF